MSRMSRTAKASPNCYMVLCFIGSGLNVLPTEYHNKQEAINVATRYVDNNSDCFETCVVAEYPTENVEEWNSNEGFVCRLVESRRY